MTTTAPVPVRSATVAISAMPEQPERAERRRRRLETLVVVHGVSVAALLSADDPFPWPQVRAVLALAITAGACWTVRHAGRRLRGMALLGLGLLGVIVGGAIGLPHAVRAGVGLESVAGIVALLTGLALIVVATRTLTQGAWWRKLVAVPVGIALAFGIVFPLALATFVTNVPPLRAGHDTPADRGLAYEEVALRTDDGVRLAAWYVPSTNGAAVVVLAGASGVRADELDHAAVLARHGYGVLLVDVRGHGASDGDAMLWGWHGASDVRAAVDHLSTRADVRSGRIAALGMSMGAEEAINAVGADPRVRAVVAEGASGQGASDDGSHQTDGWVARWFDWSTTRAADLMTSADRPARLRDSIVDAAPRPVLVIAGGEEPAEIKAGRLFLDAAPDSVELWVVPGSAHTKGYDTAPIEWEQRVTGFLDRNVT